jgi:hypothetical protein
MTEIIPKNIDTNICIASQITSLPFIEVDYPILQLHCDLYTYILNLYKDCISYEEYNQLIVVMDVERDDKIFTIAGILIAINNDSLNILLQYNQEDEIIITSDKIYFSDLRSQVYNCHTSRVLTSHDVYSRSVKVNIV